MQLIRAQKRVECEPGRFQTRAATSRDYNPELDVRVLLTRVDPRTKDAAEMMVFLTEQKLTVLPTKVCERVAFRRSIGEGVIVQELGKDQAAIAEIEAFFREVQA